MAGFGLAYCGVIPAGLLLLLAGADLAFGRPAALHVRRREVRRWQLDTETGSVLELVRQPGAGGMVRIEEAWPEQLQPVGPAPSAWVESGAEVVMESRVRPLRHGLLRWQEVFVQQRTLLGLWDLRLRLQLPAEVEVLPQVILGDEALRQLRDQGELGIRRSRQRGEGHEFESLREYRAGDEPTRIDWKASARAGRVVSRQFTVEKDHDLILAVDFGRIMGARFGGVAKCEHALSASLTLAQQGLLAGDRVGLFAFHSKAGAFVPPAKASGQLERLLSAAARMKSEIVETDFERSFSWLGQRHRKRSLLVVFTDFVDAAAAEQMVHVMGTIARRHAILFVAVTDPTLEEVLSEPAEDEASLAAQASAFLMRKERQIVLQKLRGMGLQVLDLPPERMVGAVLNRYFEMRELGVV